MAVSLTDKQARQLVKAYDGLTAWIRDHAELCETDRHLTKLDRDGRRAGSVIDEVERQLKPRTESAPPTEQTLTT